MWEMQWERYWAWDGWRFHGLSRSWSISMCSPTQKVVSPTVQRLHYVGMTDEIIDDWLVTQSAAHLFSLEAGCGAQSTNFLIKAWSFWWPAPILKLSRDLKELLHWKKRDCFQPNHLGNPKDFRGLVPELRTNTKYPSVIPQRSSSASSKMETEGSGS